MGIELVGVPSYWRAFHTVGRRYTGRQQSYCSLSCVQHYQHTWQDLPTGAMVG